MKKRKGFKGIFMIIPENIHKKLAMKALDKKTTMTALFIKWVESL